MIFLFSSSSRSRGGKVRSARGHVAAVRSALVGEPALSTGRFGMTFWDGDVQYVSNMLVIFRRRFIILK